MPFFKSFKSKNQTGPAATTPSQTPRSSKDQRSKPHQMTREEALETLMTITMGNAASAATTPSQPPRSSKDQRSKPHQMTREEALEKLMTITMGNAASGPYIL
ncbi:hypothetical protein BGZ93_002025 [Podila epicladia]|nr:hypothetical protein BGZ92_002453 [Podila epicladia]KAG0083134.1 hypothetical protein BGZ93_002025 [Podila epicladia]